MALPFSFTDLALGTNANKLGPFKSSGGAFYVVAQDATDLHKIRVLKATDPSSSWSEQDNANAPAFAGSGSTGSAPVINAIAVKQVGDTLHIAFAGEDLYVATDDEADIIYSTFDMASDAWAITNEEAVNTHLPDNALLTIDIDVRSDGDVIVCYVLDDSRNVKGTKYDDVFYARREAGAWTPDIGINDSNAVDYRCARLARGDSDAMHFVYVKDDGTNAHLMQKALSSANALQNERDTGADCADVENPIGFGVSFARSSTTRLRFPFKDNNLDLVSLQFDAAADPSTFTSSSVDANEPRVVGGALMASMAVDGSTVHCMWADNTDGDLYEADDADSDAWTARTNSLTGTIDDLGGVAVYSRSGSTVLAHVVDDGGTVKYDEDSLVSGDTISPSDATHSQPADAAAFVQSHILTVGAATQDHAVDNATLSEAGEHTLVVAEATQAHAADAAAFIEHHTLTVAEASHAQTADGASSTQTHMLAAGNAAHGQAGDDAALIQRHVVAAQNAAQAHSADGAVFAQPAILVPGDTAHGHAADAAELAQLHALVVANATHGLASDQATLERLSTVYGPDRIAAVSALSRTITIDGQDRIATATARGRAVTARGRSRDIDVAPKSRNIQA